MIPQDIQLYNRPLQSCLNVCPNPHFVRLNPHQHYWRVHLERCTACESLEPCSFCCWLFVGVLGNVEDVETCHVSHAYVSQGLKMRYAEMTMGDSLPMNFTRLLHIYMDKDAPPTEIEQFVNLLQIAKSLTCTT